jgi:hypothetical protein
MVWFLSGLDDEVRVAAHVPCFGQRKQVSLAFVGTGSADERGQSLRYVLFVSAKSPHGFETLYCFGFVLVHDVSFQVDLGWV